MQEKLCQETLHWNLFKRSIFFYRDAFIVFMLLNQVGWRIVGLLQRTAMQRYDYLARDAELFSPKDGREFCVLECLLKEVVKNKYKDCSSWCSIGYAVVWDKDHCSNTVHNCITQSEDFSAHSLLVHILCELVWKSRGEIEDMGFSFRTDEQNPWSYIEVTLVVWLILQFSLAALVILLGHRMSRISKSLYNARIRNSLLRVNSEKQNSTKHRMLMCLERSIKGITALLNFRVLVNIIQICLSILVCLLSTITISIQEVHWIWAAFRTFFLLFFVFDFVARARLHSGPIYRFLFEGFTIADLLSIVSMIVSLSSWPSLAFLRAFVAVSAFRELRPILKTKFRISSVSSELLILIIEATALLYAFATLIFLLEKLGDPTWLSFSRDSVSFFNALYFVFITATTVGYGDSLITTFLAQLFVILFVILGIMIFADRISKIVQYMNASRDGLGNFSNPYQDPFVILAGDLTFNMVQDFLEEFYHPNSIVDALDMRRRVVILSKSINAAGSVFITEYERFLENNPALIGRLQILVGSPMNASDLIHRARAREADCMFIISNSLAEDSHLDDTANIFRAMAVQRMAPELRVFLSLQNSTAMNILPAARLSENRSICTGVSKMQIMAISSFVPGFSTFLHSLVKTYCSQHDHNQPSSTSWSGQNDFQRGLDREFYVVKSRHEDAGKKLGELALDLFLNHDIIVVGFAYFVSYANEGSRRSSRGIRQSIASEISEERPQRSIRCVFDPNAPIALSSLLLVIADDRIQASLAGMWHESNISKSKLDLSIVRKDSGISRWLKASKQMIFSDAPSKNSIFPADEFLDGGVITSKCFGNNSDIRSDGFIFHPPPSNLVDHIIVICSSLDSVPHFVEKHRVIEMGCSSKENSSLGNSPWTPIVIVLTSSQPESTNCFNFVPSKFLREVYLIRSTLQNALDFKQICAHKAKSVRLSSISFASIMIC